MGNVSQHRAVQVNIFFFCVSLKKKKLSKKLLKEIKKLSKIVQKIEKLPIIVLLTGTVRCPLTQPKSNYSVNKDYVVASKLSKNISIWNFK